MQHPNSSFRRFVFLLFLCASALALLGCQQKSAPDQPPSPTPAPAPPSPTSAPPEIKLDSVPAGTPAAVVAPSPAAPATSKAKSPEITQGQDFEMALLDASKLKLTKLLGRRKVVVINFWATWCGPCRREIPDLIALQNIYQSNKDVEILGLTVEDPQQFRDLVKDFSKQFQLNYKVGFAPGPMFMAFNGAMPNAPIPQTFIFGKDGKLLQHITGLRPAFKDYIQQTVDLALKA